MRGEREHGKRHDPPQFSDSDPLQRRLLGAFFRFMHIPWHMVPVRGLSRSETGLLLSIERSMRHNKPIRVSDLSKMMRVSSPTVTQHMNNMEAQGFVVRSQSSEDKRAVHIELTELGADALAQHREAMEQNIGELTDRLGTEDAEKFIELIQRTSEFFFEKERTYDNEI